MLIPIQTGLRRAFFAVLFGQLLSLIGSGLTGFALGVWVYQTTGSATRFALIAFFASLPGILSSPFAGVLADRFDRRHIMILSDGGAALCALSIALLFLLGGFALWHIYLLVAVNSIFVALQWPAYMAAITHLVPKEQYGRASGMVQSTQAAAQIISPMLAGALMVSLSIQSILLIDFVTFLCSIVLLLVVEFPRVPPTDEQQQSKGTFIEEALFGWYYLKQRRGLMALLVFFALSNFLIGVVLVMVTPLVLSFSSPATLGLVITISGVGLLAGGLAMSIWGGPRRRVQAVLGFTLLQGVTLIVSGLRPSAVLIAGAAFLFLFAAAIVASSSQVIWQSKVAPHVQGRVFAVRRMIAWASLPLAYAVSGPLADRVFKPLLVADGPLAGSIGRVIGVGDGRGIALMLMVAGALTLLVTFAGFLYPRLRLVEDELPDMVPDT
jgi:MFS transporter, DHA3 family, macrolide efflux protein